MFHFAKAIKLIRFFLSNKRKNMSRSVTGWLFWLPGTVDGARGSDFVTLKDA